LTRLKTVFAIDRIEFMTTLIDLALANHAIHTFTHNSLDCVHFIEDMEPELLVCDAETLLEMDYKTFWQDLKSREKTKHLPVVFYGFPEQLEALNSDGLHPESTLAKPFSPLILKDFLQTVFDPNLAS
jgi:PleD family two-component response regulator